MQLGLLSYLKRDRHGTYWFRRPVKSQLRNFMPGRQGRANWMRSLATKDPVEAKKHYPDVLKQCNRDFQIAELRRGETVRTELTSDEIAALSSWFRDVALFEDEEFRLSGYREDEQLYQRNRARLLALGVPFKSLDPQEMQVDGLTRRQHTKRLEGAIIVRAGLRSAIATSNTSWISPEVDMALDAFGIRLEKSSLSYRRLCISFLSAAQEANGMLQRRLEGEHVPTPVVVEPNGDGQVLSVAIGRSNLGPTISDALTIWKNVQKPNANSVSEYGRAVFVFKQLHGDLPVADIRRSDAIAFREMLQKLPHTTHRRGKLAGASVSQLINWSAEHPECRKLSAGTINKLLGGLATICQTVRDDGHIPLETWENPFRIRKIADSAEQRLPYAAEDLLTIFKSPIYLEGLRPVAGGGEAAFWMPLLALLHGTREGELAQLLLSDVRCESGIWFYEVISDDGSGTGLTKRIKVAGKRLRIPIHQEAIRCGFLEFVAERKRKASPNDRLFAKLRSDTHGNLSGSWSKWWGNWTRKKLGIQDRRKVFHSFRHGWKDAARSAGVDEAISDAITGHSGGGLGRRYGTRGNAGYPLSVLQSAVNRVVFPVSLKHLHVTGEKGSRTR